MAAPRIVPSIRFPVTRPELPPIAEWAPILDEAYRANWFTNFGALSRRLEKELAATWGFDDTVCVLASSGTAACAAPLIARGIAGKVILPAFAFPATLSAIKMAGATPILIDVAPEDWRVSPGALEEAFARTGAEAAIVLCPFGLKSDFANHAHIAERFDAVLIIDNAAGLGVARANVESAPHVFEAYSLHATKPFGVGEGGAVFAHRSCEASLRSALNFALPTLSAPESPHWGINGKLSELHAAVGLAVAKTFAGRLERRRALAKRYVATFSEFPDIRFHAEIDDSAWQFFPLLAPSDASAAAFVAESGRRGMEVRRYYRPSLSTLHWVERFSDCPVSEDLARRMCCVPVYSNAKGEEADAMIEIAVTAFSKALAQGSSC